MCMLGSILKYDQKMVVNICWSVVMYVVYIQYVSWQKTAA